MNEQSQEYPRLVPCGPLFRNAIHKLTAWERKTTVSKLFSSCSFGVPGWMISCDQQHRRDLLDVKLQRACFARGANRSAKGDDRQSDDCDQKAGCHMFILRKDS